jgi:hypothetical protein
MFLRPAGAFRTPAMGECRSVVAMGSTGHPVDAGEVEACSRLPLIHPRLRRLPPPAIVIGMHRGGTSLVAGMLIRLGVFMGPGLRLPHPGEARSPSLILGGYGEAEAFFGLNEQLLERAGATWAQPEPLLALRNDPRFAAAAARFLQGATFGRIARNYLRGMPAGAGVWGWKDPRNTLTLPVWLRLFPDARVLHVHRDPEAAARSLHRRAQLWSDQTLAPAPASHRVARALLSPRAVVRAIRRRLVPPLPAGPNSCLDYDFCLHLARLYDAEAAQCSASLRNCVEIEYAEVLADPAGTARLLAEHTGTDPDAEQVARAVALVKR